VPAIAGKERKKAQVETKDEFASMTDKQLIAIIEGRSPA
jgi:hypothetical protein